MSYGFAIHYRSDFDLPKSYAEARALWEGSRKRKLANNTYLEAVWIPGVEGDGYAVRLHSTKVVTFYPDGRIKLDSDGWQTSTTRDRMRRCGVSIYTSGGVVGVTWGGREYVYRDGMVLHPDGTATGHGGDDADAARRERRRALRKDKDGWNVPRVGRGFSERMPGGNTI